MQFDLFTLIFTSVVNVSLGLFVLSRGVRSTSSRAFAVLTLCIALWVTGNYFVNYPFGRLSYNQFFNHLAFFAGYASVACGLWFSYNFPIQRPVKKLEYRLVIGLVIFAAILSLCPLVTGNVVQRNGAIAFTIGHMLFLYIICFVFTLGLLVRNMLRVPTATKLQKEQARLVLIAFSVTALLGLILNLIVPILVSDWEATRVGPFMTMLLVVVITYTIVKHHLFDIKTLFVRSITYALTLSSMAILFGVIVFAISRLVFNLKLSFGVEFSISIFTALAALIFSSLRSYFDHVTNRLFYRDGYDAQTLIDTLNRIFVDNTNLNQLLKDSAQIISTNLKSEFCFFRIAEEESTGRVVGNRPYKSDPVDVETFQKLLPKHHQKLLVANELDAKHNEIAQILTKYEVAIVCKLETSAKRTGQLLGYMVLGERRSGNPYNEKDLRILEIIVNELVIAIENSLRFEEIQQFNATLQEKINVATQNLRKTNKKLHDLDETKDEFITMASHQLRTPLTSVKGYLSMVLEGDAGEINKQQRELLTQSFLSAQRMVFLISDLLNLSRLNTGKFVIETAPVQLLDIVKSEVDQLRETAHARQVELNLTMPDTLPELLLDETKIHQVVMNFMDNAVYYTPAGGSIEVSLRETPSAIEYMVRDNGIGVPKSEQHRLFTKFYRAGNARQARPDGTGLGLFMAKKVIVAQGGSILFESVEGKGSSFGFRFNKADHVAPTEVPQSTQSPARELGQPAGVR